LLRFQYNWAFTLGITKWGVFSAKSGYFYYAIHTKLEYRMKGTLTVQKAFIVD